MQKTESHLDSQESFLPRSSNYSAKQSATQTPACFGPRRRSTQYACVDVRTGPGRVGPCTDTQTKKREIERKQQEIGITRSFIGAKKEINRNQTKNQLELKVNSIGAKTDINRNICAKHRFYERQVGRAMRKRWRG